MSGKGVGGNTLGPQHPGSQRTVPERTGTVGGQRTLSAPVLNGTQHVPRQADEQDDSWQGQGETDNLSAGSRDVTMETLITQLLRQNAALQQELREVRLSSGSGSNVSHEGRSEGRGTGRSVAQPSRVHQKGKGFGIDEEASVARGSERVFIPPWTSFAIRPDSLATPRYLHDHPSSVQATAAFSWFSPGPANPQLHSYNRLDSAGGPFIWPQNLQYPPLGLGGQQSSTTVGGIQDGSEAHRGHKVQLSLDLDSAQEAQTIYAKHQPASSQQMSALMPARAQHADTDNISPSLQHWSAPNQMFGNEPVGQRVGDRYVGTLTPSSRGNNQHLAAKVNQTQAGQEDQRPQAKDEATHRVTDQMHSLSLCASSSPKPPPSVTELDPPPQVNVCPPMPRFTASQAGRQSIRLVIDGVPREGKVDEFGRIKVDGPAHFSIGSDDEQFESPKPS